MWETMGSIGEREKEILGASDQAVVEFRRGMVAFVKEFMKSGQLPAQFSDDERASVRSFEGIVPKETDWRDMSGAKRAPSRAAE